ncbi:DSC E3 ubiquitin ligase complex subunit 3 [Trametes pubescens]|uniref:DSC E3 ubiquitin ligase complex subunit 3 n=1 Tax=Trametes pubescens TaxID=154538 RepID=A0A1M2VWV1_TRAPU|nr:DSC E3 ubiquitin ligase complex subunit 3 [Trametes pubescens]
MTTSLSEKAKGKQRAAAPFAPEQLATEQPPDSPPSKDLTIRFTEGIPDLTVQVAEKDTVKDVKDNIRNIRPELKDRRLRFIHAGQLLAESTPIYARISSIQHRKRGSEKQRDEDEESTEPASSAGTTWLHCSVGPQLSEGEDESNLQTAQLKPLRGFDRLAAAGFSEEDIANIRLQFHTHSARDYLDQEFDDQEDYDEHARVLEEQWIDSLDGGSSNSQSQTAVSSLHNGIVLGFFFPLIPFFFFRSNKPAVFWDDGSEHQTLSAPVFS